MCTCYPNCRLNTRSSKNLSKKSWETSGLTARYQLNLYRMTRPKNSRGESKRKSKKIPIKRNNLSPHIWNDPISHTQGCYISSSWRTLQLFQCPSDLILSRITSAFISLYAFTNSTPFEPDFPIQNRIGRWSRRIYFRLCEYMYHTADGKSL